MEDLGAKIAAHSPSPKAVAAVRSVRSILLVGISGAGKDTIKQRLLTTGQYRDIISHTTRKPRENRGKLEHDGIDYHFVDKADVAAMLDAGEIIEANLYGGNIYATSVAEFEKTHQENKIGIIDIDVNGVTVLKSIAPSRVCPVFLTPPSFDVWFERWKKRYGDDYRNYLDDFERRKQTAIDELRHVLATPYYLFVVNDDLEKALDEVAEISKSGMQSKREYQRGRQVVEHLLAQLEAKQDL